MNSGEKGLPFAAKSIKQTQRTSQGWIGINVWSKNCFSLQIFWNQHSILHYDQSFPGGAMFFSGEKVKSRLMAGPFWFCQVLLACKSYRRFSTWCVVAYANTQVRIVTFTGLWLCSPFLGIQKETLWMCGKITSATELWLAVTGCDAGCQVTQLKYTKFVHEAISWALAVSCGSWPTSERPPLAITTITKGIPCGPYLVQPWMTSNHQDALYIMLSTSSIP